MQQAAQGEPGGPKTQTPPSGPGDAQGALSQGAPRGPWGPMELPWGPHGGPYGVPLIFPVFPEGYTLKGILPSADGLASTGFLEQSIFCSCCKLPRSVFWRVDVLAMSLSRLE